MCEPDTDPGRNTHRYSYSNCYSHSDTDQNTDTYTHTSDYPYSYADTGTDTSTGMRPERRFRPHHNVALGRLGADQPQYDGGNNRVVSGKRRRLPGSVGRRYLLYCC
jgi:hypothetical protein